MKQKIQNFINENNLFCRNDTVVIAVSGGIDSMVLLSILHDLKYHIIVAHINHNVREESIYEQRFVKEYCSSLNVPFESTTLPKINEGNFHEKARQLRYDFFYEIAEKYHTKNIITAHHADDLLETVLMRLTRGSNLYGYGGIKAKNCLNGYVITRPMLCVSRKEIISYQQTNSIPYCEDQSNAADKYTRNRFRHHIIPSLIEENNDIYRSILHYSQIVFSSFDYIRKNVIELSKQWDNKIINEEYKNLDTALQLDYLAYQLENKVSLSYEKLNKLRHFILSSLPNQRFDLGKNYILKRNYETSIIEEKRKRLDYEFILNLDESVILPNGDCVKISRKITNNEDIFLKICYNTTRLPLIIRNRRPGDFFIFPYGKKKLKDFFINSKISLEKREMIPIVLDMDNNILGIPGIIKGPKDVVDPLYIIVERRK